MTQVIKIRQMCISFSSLLKQFQSQGFKTVLYELQVWDAPVSTYIRANRIDYIFSWLFLAS